MEHGRGAIRVLTQVHHVATTGSTNADMLAFAAGGASEASWLRADQQCAGRGRQGRTWVSPSGNLYASTLVRWRPTDPPAATLALTAAVAMAEAVSDLDPPAAEAYPRGAALGTGIGRRAVLKWPNDLLVDGAKVSGMLLERAGDAVVIGFGLNLAHHPDLPDRPTTSLAAAGVSATPELALAALRPRVAAWLDRWRAEGIAPVRERWLALAQPAGTPLAARLPDGSALNGSFAGLGPDGALLLRLADGSTRAIHAGDVFTV